MWMDHRAVQETVTINLTNDPVLRYVGAKWSIEMELPFEIPMVKKSLSERYKHVWRFFDLADFLWKVTTADVASIRTLTCKWNYLAHQGHFSESLLADVGLDELLEKVPQTILAFR